MGQKTLINSQSTSQLYNLHDNPNNKLYYNASTSSRPTNYSTNTYRSTLNSSSTLNTTSVPRKTHSKHPSCVNLFPNTDKSSATENDHTVIDFFESEDNMIIQQASPPTTENTLKNKISIASSIQKPKLVHKQSSSETVINEVMENVNKTIFQDLVSFSQLNHNTPVILPVRYSCDSITSRDSKSSTNSRIYNKSYGIPRKASTLSSFSMAKFKQLVQKSSSSNMERAVTSTTYKCEGSETSELNNSQLYQNPQYTLPQGSILFVVGFIFFPCWWIGAKYPKIDLNTHTKEDIVFRKLNFYMSLFSIPLIALIIGCLIWYFVAY